MLVLAVSVAALDVSALQAGVPVMARLRGTRAVLAAARPASCSPPPYAALFLGEPAGRRLAGAVVVVAGITVLALA